jgi:transcriptional regulator with XRE-family HTH domain
MPTIGENLRAARKQRRLGQVELGHRSGISQQSISDIERDKRDPHPSTLRKLAAALNVPVGSFFAEEALPKVPHTRMEADEFDELRRAASAGRIDGSSLLSAVQGEYDAIERYHRALLEKGAAVDVAELEEALALLVEARRRFRVILFDRTEETLSEDDERDPRKIERPDTRFLTLEQADARLRSVQAQLREAQRV